MASIAAGISFSRLTSHRHTRSTDSGRIVDTSPSAALTAMSSPTSTQDDILLYDPPKKHKQQQQERRRSRSWLPSTRRGTSSTPVMIRSGQSLHRISSPLPPVLPPGMTIHPSSSTSSLCSCHGERGREGAPLEHPMEKKSISLRDASGSRCVSPASSPGQPPKRPARPKHGLYEAGFDDEEVSPQSSPRQSFTLPVPSFTDKLPLEVADDLNKQDVQLLTDQQQRHRQQDSWSEDVQQLIQEADQAFKAVGSALAGTKLSSYTFGQPNKPTIPNPPSPVLSRRHSRSMSTSSDTAKTQQQNKGTPLLRRPSESGKASVTKPQRKKKKAAAAGGKRGATWPGKKWPGKAMRWTLTENVADILSGQRFKKIVADEMLTPTRIEELTRDREEGKMEAKVEGKSEEATPAVATATVRGSTESTRSSATGSTETPAEPFHLENLAASRIGATGVSASAPPTAPPTKAPPPTPMKDPRQSLTPPPMMFDQDVVRSDFSLQTELARTRDNDSAEEDSDEALTPVDVLAFPLPPPKNPARNTFRGQMKRLPTIPEVLGPSRDISRHASTSGPSSSEPRKSQDSDTSTPQERIPNDAQYCLNSTPYTLTRPSFRHGPITFQRAETSKGHQSLEEVDEALDWTSFQMAILGGAGELEKGMEEDEERFMADEVAAWFEGFGFESHGMLVPAHLGRRVSRSAKDSEMPIPVASEYQQHTHSHFHAHSHQQPRQHQSQHHQQKQANNIPRSDIPAPLDTTKFLRSKGLRQWTPEGYQKRQSSVRDRMTTSSTIGPLIVGGEGSVDEEAVDMGCNLEHDLGAFLKWETEHVYGGTF